LDSRSVIRGYIKSNFLFGSGDATLSDDDSFFVTRIIDSKGMLELVSFIDAELVPENLDSISRLVGFIDRKKVASTS
jgi:hypothetical protein